VLMVRMVPRLTSTMRAKNITMPVTRVPQPSKVSISFSESEDGRQRPRPQSAGESVP